MMLPEAYLDVTLHEIAGSVGEVRIRSTRQVQASRLFSGRQPGEVLTLLPTVFSLCGTAQAMAGLMAVEQAGGISAADGHLAARRLLLLAENVAEHGLSLARDCPTLIGESPDLAAARRIKTAMASLRQALYPAGDWKAIGGGALAPDRPLLQRSLASAGAALAGLVGTDAECALADADAFDAWLADPRGIGRVLDVIIRRGWAGFGTARFIPMPPSGPPDLAARLAADDAGGYLALPDSGGTVYETGPLARRAGHPLIAALLARHGTGLLPRLAARLVDVAECLREMGVVMQDLTAAAPGGLPLVAGIGIGMVEAARGTLVHRVELEDGRVKSYQILAPTEWNFHPKGALARALAGSTAGRALDEQARFLAHALDPCVACAIRVERAYA